MGALERVSQKHRRMLSMGLGSLNFSRIVFRELMTSPTKEEDIEAARDLHNRNPPFSIVSFLSPKVATGG